MLSMLTGTKGGDGSGGLGGSEPLAMGFTGGPKFLEPLRKSNELALWLCTWFVIPPSQPIEIA